MTTPATVSQIPDWAQAAGSFLVFMVASGFAVYGWLKSKLAATPDFTKANEKGSTDTVVLSAAIADSASINRLANAIEGMIAAQNTDARKMDVIADRLEMIYDQQRMMNDRLKDWLK